MDKIRNSLSRKLGISLLLMAATIFVLSLGIFYMRSHNLIHQNASKRANSILNTVLQRVVSYMGTVETAAKSNAWLLEEKFTPDSLQAISYRIVSRNPSILSCSVGTEPDIFPESGHYFSVFTVNDGDTILSVREPNYEYFEKMWYKTAHKADKACWINPFMDYTEAALDHNDAVASYSVPLHSSDGSIVGIVATDFSFSSLTKTITASEHPYPNAYFMLLGGDGRFLIHPNKELLFKKTIFSDTDAETSADLIALGHEMTAGRSGASHVNIGDEYCHVSYCPVPGTDWSLALVIPSEEMMGPYLHLGYVIIVIIIVGMVIILMLCYRVVRQTTNPIKRLVNTTKMITDGHYDEIIPLSTKSDAVAKLQNSFSAMQQAILSHMGQIDDAAKQIDQYNMVQEDKLERAEESVRRKNLFMSNVLYHVKEPLDTILKCANQMLDNTALPDKELEILTDEIKQSTVTMHRMVLMLFDSSDIRAADPSMYNRENEVECNKIAQDCIDYIHSQFPHTKMSLETEVPDDFKIVTNHLYLRQTIRELLYNAAKYSDGHNILVHVAKTAATVRYTVQDTGQGLPDEPHELLFKPFMKVDNLSEGLGLGLPLCKRHIESLGGSLFHDTKYKEGCRIIFELPIE